MSGSWSPAARLATTLPIPHANAATSTSTKPTSVAVAPPSSLYAASSTMPAVAISAPATFCAETRSPRYAMPETDREEHLHLDDQRGQSRGHAELHAQEQQAELAHADGDAIADDVSPRHLRSPDEEHQRHGGEARSAAPPARTEESRAGRS